MGTLSGAETSIYFHSENLAFTLRNKRLIRQWILSTIEKEGQNSGELSFVFCTDQHLHDINIKYLDHDTLTDIITFDYSEDGAVAGDIFISLERVRDNAKSFRVNSTHELHRVIIHGVLHLLGYTDKTPAAKSQMTEKEDFYLSLRTF